VTGKETKFVQDNHSKSKKGILRGLHFQKKRTQGKLVRVISGKIFDVAVDVRRDSPTFGKSVAVILSEKNMRQLWIPEGFAHGFYVMSQSVDFAYKCTEFYEPNSNVTLDWEDKQLGIDWPISGEVVLSENDKEGKSFNQCLNEDLLL
jgi:dTDP-4-dehydrorhamnose 3,5-epimerase